MIKIWSVCQITCEDALGGKNLDKTQTLMFLAEQISVFDLKRKEKVMGTKIMILYKLVENLLLTLCLVTFFASLLLNTI